MQPADTVRRPRRTHLTVSDVFAQTLTRMYNQPTVKGPDGRTIGVLYKNPIDCLWKTFKTEGILGWYKGTLDNS